MNASSTRERALKRNANLGRQRRIDERIDGDGEEDQPVDNDDKQRHRIDPRRLETAKVHDLIGKNQRQVNGKHERHEANAILLQLARVVGRSRRRRSAAANHRCAVAASARCRTDFRLAQAAPKETHPDEEIESESDWNGGKRGEAVEERILDRRMNVVDHVGEAVATSCVQCYSSRERLVRSGLIVSVANAHVNDAKCFMMRHHVHLASLMLHVGIMYIFLHDALDDATFFT